MTGRSAAGWGSRMGWVLCLVETGIDKPPRASTQWISGPLGDLRDIAKPRATERAATYKGGLTLSETKQILAYLQQVVVAIQTDDHAVLHRIALRAVKSVKSRTGGFIG
jgi:hypothetical protein